MKDFDYSDFYTFYMNLEDESKIIVVQKIMAGELDTLLDLVDGHEIIFDMFDYDSVFEEEDTPDLNRSGESFEDSFSLDQIDDILNIRTKGTPKDTDAVVAIVNHMDREIHLSSNSKEEIDKFVYRNLFLKGIFFLKSDNQEAPKGFKHKYYVKYDFLGQLEQDLCLN